MPPPITAAADHGIGYRPIDEADLPFLAALYASTRAEEVAAQMKRETGPYVGTLPSPYGEPPEEE